jgi:hypothetical protein
MEHYWHSGYNARMETYTESKPFKHNLDFKADRLVALDNLDLDLIDPPLVKLVREINMLPYLFTLQCCYGHFLKKDGIEISNLELLETNVRVEYRLAYIAFCIENSFSGKNIIQKIMSIPSAIDRDKIQFCSAQWFWDQWLNSYALQVMPKRFKDRDTAQLEYAEVREIEKVRDYFFVFLEDFIARLSS